MAITAHLHRLIQDQSSGAMLLGATVTICEPGSTTPITEQLFTDEAMATPVANPFICANGIIDVYLAAPKTVAILATYGTRTFTVDYVDVLPNAECFLVTSSPVIVGTPTVGYVPQMADATHLDFVDPSTFGGGGGLDTPMPTLTAPTLFHRDGTSGVAWDGLDVSAATMPVGFLRAQLQQQSTSYLPYSAVANGTWDTAGMPNTDPFLPTGWSDINGSTYKVISGSGALKSLPFSTPLGFLGSTSAAIGIDTGSSHQKVTVSIDPATLAGAWQIYLLFALDSLSSATPSMNMIAITNGGNGCYTLNSDGSYSAVTFGTITPPGDGIFVVTVEGSLLTIEDSSAVVLQTDTIPIKTGTHFGVFSQGTGQDNILAITALEAAPGTAGPWTEVAALSGAGVALIPLDGEFRWVAQNEAGNLGSPSTTATISYPTPTPPPALNVVSGASVGTGSIAIDSTTAGSGTSAALGTAATALGGGTSASGADSVAIGGSANAGGIDAVALGNGTTAPVDHATAVGHNAVANGLDSTAVGSGASADATNSFAVGVGAIAHSAAHDAVVVGTSAAVTSEPNTVVIGPGASDTVTAALGDGEVVLGHSATASASGGVAIGNAADVAGVRGIGILGSVTGDYGTAVGNGSIADYLAVAVGDAWASAPYALALGRSAVVRAGANGGVAIGSDHTGNGPNVTGIDEFVLGTANHKVQVPGQFGINGNTPVGKAANPGTAAGTDAAVINAIVTMLRDLGVCS